MSENQFKIEHSITSIKYDIQVCGFFPSFINGINQNVTFGIQSEFDSNGQIFYGIDNQPSTSSYVNTYAKPNDNLHVNNLSSILQELDYYLAFKKLYFKRNKQINPKYQNSIIHSYSINQIFKFNSGQSNNNMLEKDEEEEHFFKHNYQKYKNFFKNNNFRYSQNINEKNNSHYSKHHSNDFTSPGFLFKSEITGVQSLNSVNTEFYAIYQIKKAGSSDKIILEREIISGQGQSNVDNSMLSLHYDFLLYYDKKKSDFIYDNEWSMDDTVEEKPKSYFWKIMKWFLSLIIILFSIILVFIVVGVVNYSKKKKRICCFKNKNLNQEINEDEYNLNMEYPNTNRRASRHRRAYNPNNLNESELETICYDPNLEDQITYNNCNESKKQKKKSCIIESYDSVHSSDSYTYEYDYYSSSSNDDYNINEPQRKRRAHIKKKIKTTKLNSSTKVSPYDMTEKSMRNLRDISIENLTISEDNQDEGIPNPYALPSY